MTRALSGGGLTLAHPSPATRLPAFRGRQALAGVVAALALLLGSACSAVPTPPTGAEPPATPPGSPSRPTSAETILAEALEDLRRASSFRFQAQAVHQWQFAGRTHEWVFVGEGAYQAPDHFYSRLEGPGDVDLRLAIKGNQVWAADSRGPVANPTLAFGGPGNGASPFTVIAYLRNYAQASSLTPAVLGNTETFRIGFVPNLSQVAALDPGQSRAVARIQSVEGQVWVDRDQRRLRQQQVTVTSLEPRGETSRVQVTLRFSDFNRPVDIKTP